MALGASRMRIADSFLTESLLLSLVGGGVGLLSSSWAVRLLVAYGPPDVPRLQDVQLNASVLIFTFVLSTLTGVLFGLAPALQASKPNPGNMLKDTGRGISQGRNRIRNALIVSEVALSLVLLVSAGLLINSFIRLLQTDAGFTPQDVVTLDIPLSRTKYPKPELRAAAFQQLVGQMKSIPGVQAASVVSNIPMNDLDIELSFQIEGRVPFKPGEEAVADYTVAGSDYFRTMNITLNRGRAFTESDTSSSPEVMIVSQTFVKRYFPTRIQ
jgi:hypothetical protein